MRPMLRFGSRGEPVLQVQRVLNGWVLSREPPLTEDGIFGARTGG
jgi:hypothetical protein